MKRLVRTCIAILTALTISQTAFAATGELLGDVSKGNHPDAPYAASEIIVPRPSQSAYGSLPLYANGQIPVDIQGHWAESAIRDFLQRGYISGSGGYFYPNTPATYGDFAEIAAHFGLNPVTFYGGQDASRIFSDRFSWDSHTEPGKSALICGEAGVWGNPNENLAGIYFTLEQPAQRQYIALFLSNFLEENQTAYTTAFTDTAQCSFNIQKAISQLVNTGILSGFGDGTFRPNAVVTKAELVTTLYRLLQQNGYDMEKLSEQLYGNYHDFYWEESAKLLDLVNQERKKNGVPTLRYDADLQALCEIKNIERSLNGYSTFEKLISYDGKTIADGHVSKYWGRATQMAADFGLSDYLVGENAVKNAATADKAHRNLTNSQAHRENYLNPKYQVAGFAVGEKLTYEMFAYFK